MLFSKLWVAATTPDSLNIVYLTTFPGRLVKYWDRKMAVGVTLPQGGFYPTLFYYIYFTLQCRSSCSILTFESVATGNKTELKTKHIKWMQLHFSCVRLRSVLGSFWMLRQGMDLAVMLRVPDVPVCNLVPQNRIFVLLSFMVFFSVPPIKYRDTTLNWPRLVPSIFFPSTPCCLSHRCTL